MANDLWEHKSGPGVGTVVVLVLLAVLASTGLGEALDIGTYLVRFCLYAVVLALLGMVSYLAYRFVRDRLSAETRVRARVVRKFSRDWDLSTPLDTAETAAARLGMLGRNPEAAYSAYSRSMASPEVREVGVEGKDYYIVFACGRKQTEFLVPEEVYADLPEGAEGLLVYQGDMFRQFLKRL